MTIPDNSDRPGARIPCETRNVFGFSVAVSSVEEMSAALAERALEAEAPFLVAAADAHVVTLGVHDRDYGNVLERMDVICPDGMPVVWRLNRGLSSGEREACRVSGPDLMEALVRSNVQYPGRIPLRSALGRRKIWKTCGRRLLQAGPMWYGWGWAARNRSGGWRSRGNCCPPRFMWA